MQLLLLTYREDLITAKIAKVWKLNSCLTCAEGKIGFFLEGGGVKIYRKGGKMASGGTIFPFSLNGFHLLIKCTTTVCKRCTISFFLHSVIFVYINTMKNILIPFKLLNSMVLYYLLTK